MGGLSDFTTEVFNYRNVVTKTTAYTVLAADEYIRSNGTVTLTLPSLDSFVGTTNAKKVYRVDNVNTAKLICTIQPGTNTVTGVADTVNGKAIYTLKPNESIIISGQAAGTNWSIASPYPQPTMDRVTWTAIATIDGADGVNLFDADGAPADINITNVFAVCTVASGSPSIINLFTGTSGGADSLVIASFTPGAAIGDMAGCATTLANTKVAKGVAIRVRGNDAGAGHIVYVQGTVQTRV